MSKGRRARKKPKAEAEKQPKPGSAKRPGGSTPPRQRDEGVRGMFDALVLAFVLAMFVRVFLFELFKIPTGSMIPTIVGGVVAEVDLNGDGIEDLAAIQENSDLVFAFYREGDRYVPQGIQRVGFATLGQWDRDGLIERRYDRIFVNKFTYWFGLPDRGDIAVFKVPPSIWQKEKPLYIKRVVALPEDTLSFDESGGPIWNEGETEVEHEFLDVQKYETNVSSYNRQMFDWVDYGPAGEGHPIERVHVPKDGVYMMGDNTNSSLDSRYWGDVKLNRLRGKAFFRYWPLSKAGFID